MTRTTRRVFLAAAWAAALGLPLAGCSLLQSPNRKEFSQKLQDAVSATPSFVSGEVGYTNGIDTGLTIGGDIEVRGTTRQEALESLRQVLRSIAVVCKGVEFPGDPDVILPVADPNVPGDPVDSGEAAGMPEKTFATVGDLLKYFHLT